MTTSQNRRVFDFNFGDNGSDYAGEEPLKYVDKLHVIDKKLFSSKRATGRAS